MEAGRQRIDKWLFFARLAKSRSIGARLAESGQVRVNRVKIDNAAHPLRVGDVLTLSLERGVVVVRVDGLGTRRGPYPEARLLYSDAPVQPISDA